MVVLCSSKCGNRAVLKRPKTGDALCKECFFRAFEIEIHETITKGKLFKRGDIVAIGASGGKDSTVLAYVLKLLNERYDYGLKLVLLSIDEGITGYRDDSLKTVQQNKNDYEMPLKILSYKDLYGWTMDEIVAQIGRRNNCTFCGVFRRQALDRGAALLGVNCIATGHNADDVAETVLMNILRGDLARLKRCTAIIVGSSGDIPRVKPLKYTYEKEIVMYAYFKKLVYFSTECVFAPNAYRGHARTLLKDLEKVRPSVIMDLIYSGETTCIDQPSKLPQIRTCIKCNYVSSQEICKACFLLEGLNRGLPKISIGKSSKSKRLLAEEVAKDTTKSISSKHSNSEIESSCTRCNCNKNKCSKVTNSENEIDLRKKISENLNDLENLNEVNVETCSVTNKSIKTKLEIRKDKHSNRIQMKNKTEIEKNDYENILESKINENCKIEEQSEVNKTFDLRNDVQINKKTVSLWNLPCEECVEKCNCISTKKKKIAVIMLLHQMHIQYSDDYDSDTNDF